MEPRPEGRDGLHAGLGPRLLAAVIDLGVILAGWWTAVLALIVVLASTGRLDPQQLASADPVSLALTPEGIAISLISGGVLYAISGFYLVYAWTHLGATPGQQLLGLAVVGEKTRAPLSAGQAAGRWFVLTLPPVGLLVGVLLVAWFALVASTILRHPQGRGVHDLAAGSIVIRRPRRAGRQRPDEGTSSGPT
jgi:uncharacterized RDD family membrane protein YckC